jgi:hypothetical protein
MLGHVVVPFWSSSLVVARHLPHGRSPGGDRHLKFYEARDNLCTKPVGTSVSYYPRGSHAPTAHPAT